ncbi:MAG: NfeD family protein [Arcanobacterium sp.]|nr:NfeD family protein [Arcanobacterium sp.]
MAWAIWGVIAVVLLIIELVTVDFTFIMLAGGALVAALISLGTDSLIAQVLGFAIVALVLLLFVRPVIKRHLEPKRDIPSNVYALAGKGGRALTQITESSGRVTIGGEEWSAKTQSGSIPAGENVVINRVEGVTVVVQRVGLAEPAAQM